jgi:GNAT superfamily N-acetyltransferase
MSPRPPDRRLRHVQAAELAPYVSGLRTLEAEIEYPAGDSMFTIDHGPEYTPFFTAMGDAHFVVALQDGAVVGNVAGVLKSVSYEGRSMEAVYVCDLKVSPALRGRGLARRMLAFGLLRLSVTRELRGARLLYGIAMQGSRGDVTRSARGLHPLRIARPWARCSLYFADPDALVRLQVGTCPPTPDERGGLVLSLEPCREHPGVVSTAQRKDLRISPAGRPWPLVHLPLGPGAWRPSFGHYLRACGRFLIEGALRGPACFCLDERLADHHAWLSAQGLEPGASLAVYGVDLTGASRRARWVHLASSEI